MKSSKVKTRGARGAMFTLGQPSETGGASTNKARTTTKSNGIMRVRVWGSASVAPRSSKRTKSPARIVRMENPWQPDDIVQLLKVLSISYPISKALVGIVKAWMELRAAEEVIIENGLSGNKLTIKGRVSEARLENILNQFASQNEEGDRDNIIVRLPRGKRRTIPKYLLRRRKQQNDSSTV